MNRPHLSLLRVAVTAIAVCFSICGDAAPVEQVRTQNQSGSLAADPRSNDDIEGALTRVNAARSRADADPLALEDALTALGDAFLDASQYAKAEASYNEALQLAERHAGLENERVLASLLGLSNTLAASGRHQQAVLRLQRALAIQRSQYGLFDLRQQDTLETLAASLTALDRMAERRI
jgi:tetratricopeptide (TPR) repeat protein